MNDDKPQVPPQDGGGFSPDPSSPSAGPPPPPPPPPPGPGPSGPSSGAVETNSDARMWAMLSHLLALVGLIVPFANIIAPLIIWQMKKNEYPFVDDQGKESLNFQITVFLAAIIFLVVSLVPFVGCLTMVLFLALAAYALIFTIIGGIKANEGVRYRYPWALRLIT